MENVKIKSPLIEFDIPQSLLNKYRLLFMLIASAVFNILLNSLILSAIPNIHSGSIVFNAILLFSVNSIFALISASFASVSVLTGKFQLKINKISICLFLGSATILSFISSLLLYWAAGCSSDACDIRDGCHYLLKMLFAYGVSLLICCLIGLSIIALLFNSLMSNKIFKHN